MIFGGMVRPDTGAVFMKRHVQRPMELILDVPMLANHRDEGCGRAADAGNIDAIVTRNGSIAVGHPNGLDDHHRVEVRPFGKCRERG